MSNLTLLIPAKHEAESLPKFLEELRKFDFKKIVILDSKDYETIDSIKDFKDVIILNQHQAGYGSALIEGINSTQTELFCIINADGSMNPNELNGMLEQIRVKEIDIVFGSRYMKNAGSDDDDFITLVGNYIFTTLGKIFFNLPISDILYTYVVGKTELVKELKLTSNDFKFCIELPIKAQRKGLKSISYPSFERGRIGGKKKVSPFLDGFRILMGMFYLFFKR